MHTCDNPSCVNPEHLKLGTYSENMKDMWDKGRQGDRKLRRGEDHHKAVLTEEQVRDIKARARTGLYSELGREFGVSYITIRDISLGRTWTHI
jgi:hypothetical protein